MPTRQADGATRKPTADQVIRNLPPQHRQILVATYFRRRTTTEAAHQLGLSPETVKAQLYQAMHHLADALV